MYLLYLCAFIVGMCMCHQIVCCNAVYIWSEFVIDVVASGHWNVRRLVWHACILRVMSLISFVPECRLVKAAGSVFAVTIATIRKAVTVVLSYCIFPKELTSMHVLSLMAVGSGLVLYEINNQKQKAGKLKSGALQSSPRDVPHQNADKSSGVVAGLSKSMA